VDWLVNVTGHRCCLHWAANELSSLTLCPKLSVINVINYVYLSVLRRAQNLNSKRRSCAFCRRLRPKGAFLKSHFTVELSLSLADSQKNQAGECT